MRRYTFTYEVSTDIDGSFLSDGTVTIEANTNNNAEAQARKLIYETDSYCLPNMEPVVTLTLESVEDLHANESDSGIKAR